MLITKSYSIVQRMTGRVNQYCLPSQNILVFIKNLVQTKKSRCMQGPAQQACCAYAISALLVLWSEIRLQLEFQENSFTVTMVNNQILPAVFVIQ